MKSKERLAEVVDLPPLGSEDELSLQARRVYAFREQVPGPARDAVEVEDVYVRILGGVDKRNTKLLGHTLADQTLPRPCVAVPN